jgi:DNA-binding winged helix-turn-helix (wHTH) protein
MEPGRERHELLERLGIDYDADGRTLRQGGRERHLAPREAAVFDSLLETGEGEVVSRSVLLDAVWGDGEVCEDALTVIVSRLRRHFLKLGIRESVIETVPRKGYRLGHCPQTGARLDARRDGRLAMSLGLLALGLSTLALALSGLSLWIGLR